MSYSTSRTPGRAQRKWISTLVLVAPLTGAAFLAACSDDETSNPPPHVHSVASVSVVPANIALKIGENATVAAEARCGCGDVLDATFTFESSDADIAAITPDGVITGMALGNATVSATAEEVSADATVQVQARGSAIDAEGGTVYSDDGNVELILPAGALDALTDVEIVPVDAGMFVGDPLYIAGTGYQLKPDGLQLQERAQLRIRYDPNLVPAGIFHEQLRLRERDRDQNQWRETQQNQLQQQAMHGEIERFGVYAIVIEPAIGTMIGPAGGLVVSDDGNFELTIPPGALGEPIDITVEKLDDSMFNGDPQYIPGTAYEVKPAGLQLQEQAQLRIHYDPGNVPSGMQLEQLRIRERDRQQNRWHDPSQCSNQQNAVETGISTLGLYAIIGSVEPVPVVASITLSPSILEIEEGDVIRMLAVVLDTDGNVVSTPVTWSSSNDAVATVDQTGLVTAIAEGTAVISAEVGGVKGQASASVSKKGSGAASVTIVPATASIGIGGTVQLTAEVRDADGNLISRTVSWQTSSNSIATVSDGLVTGVAVGTATITARVQSVSGTATITVNPPVSSIVITGSTNDPLEVGETLQLTATAYDSNGQPVNWNVTWSSSNDAIATVDQAGLVTATGRGTATITAAGGTATASVDVRVVGEVVTAGNNLSYPVVFADGIGMTGLAVATDPGVRPVTAENIVVDALPFFWTGNVPTYGIYYEQQTVNAWRAEYIDGTGQAAYGASIYWGDNLTHQTWSASRPIRVEQALYATGLSLTGFNMTYLYGEGPDEMQGTDGSTAAFEPTIYTVAPTFRVDKLSGPGGSVTATLVNAAIGAEVNVGGKIVYGYNLRVTEEGYYRLTFSLAGGANVNITSVGNTEGTYLPTFGPTSSSLEIYVMP